MASRVSRRIFCCCAFALLVALGTAGQDINADYAPVISSDGYRLGRATFYDAPTYFADTYAPRSFGSILYGSCGLYNRDAGNPPVQYYDLPFAIDGVAALASTDQDYPGSCGRCYEVRCRDGIVVAEGTTPALQSNGFNLAEIAPNTKDMFGRSFPGNPAVSKNENFVQCWNGTEAPNNNGSIYIHIIDTCPCTSATANNTAWCCGPVEHFDLSFWAFELLAHPLYGTMMLDFRPVDCYTKEPLEFLPPFVNKTIYAGGMQAGWSWSPYGQYAAELAVEGEGVFGDAATCFDLTAGGGVTFECVNGTDPGLTPFANASTLTIWARNNESTPTGSVATESISSGSNLDFSLKLTLQNTEAAEYCGGTVIIGGSGQTVSPATTSGDWSEFQIPLTDFGCSGTPSLSTVDSLALQTLDGDADFCLDQIVLE